MARAPKPQKSYPAGTRFLLWSLSKEKSYYCIRRWVEYPDGKKKFERLPKKKYKDISHNIRALEDFVIRLNGKDPNEERAKANVKFKHAYISPDLLQDYIDNYLVLHIPNKKDAKSMFAYLNKYGLSFFIDKMGLSDPIDWHKQQFVWGKYLLNKDKDKMDEDKRIFPNGTIMSAKVLRYTVNEMNRFMKYLHLKRPGEVSALTFEPLTKATLKEHEAKRKMGDVHESKYITPEHWKIIKKYLDDNEVSWRFPVFLGYYYGLRRNETLGIKKTDLKKAHLAVERQLEKIVDGELKYSPLKSRQPRKVPHWFLKPEQAYAVIEGLHGNDFFHPDTLSCKFSELMEHLELPEYTFHDLRRTFITNTVKKEIAAEELRLAVGHSTIQTTYKYYVMDARELDDEVWTPKGA